MSIKPWLSIPKACAKVAVDYDCGEIRIMFKDSATVETAIKELEDQFKKASDGLVGDVSPLVSLQDDVLNCFYQLYYRLDQKKFYLITNKTIRATFIGSPFCFTCRVDLLYHSMINCVANLRNVRDCLVFDHYWQRCFYSDC